MLVKLKGDTVTSGEKLNHKQLRKLFKKEARKLKRKRAAAERKEAATDSVANSADLVTDSESQELDQVEYEASKRRYIQYEEEMKQKAMRDVAAQRAKAIESKLKSK